MATSPTKEDAKDLIVFLQEVDFVFRLIVDARAILFRKPMRELVQKAYAEVVNQIKTAIAKLEAFRKQANRTMRTALANAGLYGDQLKLKLAGYRDAYNRFVERGTVRLLSKVLRWINKLLGSLAAAIPVVEAIKEFKDVIEVELQESEAAGLPSS